MLWAFTPSPRSKSRAWNISLGLYKYSPSQSWIHWVWVKPAFAMLVTWRSISAQLCRSLL